MEILRVREKIYQKFSSPSVAIGNFDGVHLGHREIISRTVKSAHDRAKEAVVYTFDPHPRTVLNKAQDVPRINTETEREQILEALGIDVLILAEFTPEYASQTPDEFVENTLVEELGVRSLFVGENYRFGKGRAGNAAMLKKTGHTLGFTVHIVPSVKVDGVVVSSSGIRDLLIAGEIRKANELLGRYFKIGGKVIHGHNRGKKLGFPTANIKPDPKLHPPHGVYAAYCALDSQPNRLMPAVMNIGWNPTFKDRRVSYETHILDFDREIYGERIQVHIVERIRPEMTFSDIEELRRQISKDISVAEEIFDREP
ncbi:MAG: bifunctional riboflavin kinase/FAD synthetase [Desulfomonilaceae bacterium]